MLPEAMARYFSVGVAIRYVLPVLWTTSCLRMPGISDATTASTPTHRGATPDRRAKSDIYDRLVTIFYAKTATTL